MQNYSLNQVVKDIKSLKIQGAKAVSYSAVAVFDSIVHKSKARSTKEFLNEMNAARKKLEEEVKKKKAPRRIVTMIKTRMNRVKPVMPHNRALTRI